MINLTDLSHLATDQVSQSWRIKNYSAGKVCVICLFPILNVLKHLLALLCQTDLR